MNRDSLKKKQGRRERGRERKKRRGKRGGPRGRQTEKPLSFRLPACGHPSRVAWYSRGPLCSHGHPPDERQHSASSELLFPSGLYKDGLVGVYQACSMGTSQADPWGGGGWETIKPGHGC